MLVDHHLHLERGPYTPEDYPDGWLDRYLAAAAGAGVSHLGVVEHAYRFREADGLLPGPWSAARCRYALAPYLEFVERSRRRQVPVSFGLEVDYVPGAEAGIERLLKLFDWDFVLGSVHFVDGIGVDLEEHRALAARLGGVLWHRYFALSRDAAASGLFDILTHPDLPKIFGDRSSEPLGEEYRLTAQAVAQAGMVLECNTAGLRRPVGEIYPAPGYLKAAHAAGVRVSLGSDAHEPENVGRDLAAGAALLRSAGYREVQRFVGRRAAPVPL